MESYTERSAALNKELRKKEASLTSELNKRGGSKGGEPSDADLEAMLKVRSDLSSVYIGAIKSKVELLEEINAQAGAVVPSPALTA